MLITTNTFFDTCARAHTSSTDTSWCRIYLEKLSIINTVTQTGHDSHAPSSGSSKVVPVSTATISWTVSSASSIPPPLVHSTVTRQTCIILPHTHTLACSTWLLPFRFLAKNYIGNLSFSHTFSMSYHLTVLYFNTAIVNSPQLI